MNVREDTHGLRATIGHVLEVAHLSRLSICRLARISVERGVVPNLTTVLMYVLYSVVPNAALMRCSPFRERLGPWYVLGPWSLVAARTYVLGGSKARDHGGHLSTESEYCVTSARVTMTYESSEHCGEGEGGCTLAGRTERHGPSDVRVTSWGPRTDSRLTTETGSGRSSWT